MTQGPSAALQNLPLPKRDADVVAAHAAAAAALDLTVAAGAALQKTLAHDGQLTAQQVVPSLALSLQTLTEHPVSLPPPPPSALITALKLALWRSDRSFPPTEASLSLLILLLNHVIAGESMCKRVNDEMLKAVASATAGTAASVRPQRCTVHKCMALQPPARRVPRCCRRRQVSTVAAGGTAAGNSVPRHGASSGAARLRRAAASGVRLVVRGAPAWLLRTRQPADAERDAPRCSPTAGCTPASLLVQALLERRRLYIITRASSHATWLHHRLPRPQLHPHGCAA